MKGTRGRHGDDTVYAFDQPVIPAGSQRARARGAVEPISKIRRAMAIADADFSPPHQYTVTFDTIILSNGRRLPVVTTASPGTENVVHLMSDPARAANRKNAAARAAEGADR